MRKPILMDKLQGQGPMATNILDGRLTWYTDYNGKQVCSAGISWIAEYRRAQLCSKTGSGSAQQQGHHAGAGGGIGS
jgi:hypothetical protein